MSRTITDVSPALAIPPEPATPPVTASKSKAAKTTATSVEPAQVDDEERVLLDVVPDLSEAVHEVLRWYWVGCTHDSPRAVFDVAGINFPRYTESIQRRGRERRTDRVQRAGQVIKLSDSQLERLAEALKRRVVRPVGPAPAETIVGAVDTSSRAPRQCITLTIPTPDEIAARRESGSPAFRPFVARRGDRPLADFIFLEPCVGKDFHPRDPSRELPEPISKTGVRFSREPGIDPSMRTYPADDAESLNTKNTLERRIAQTANLSDLLR
jgi:hypothetical protein